MDMKRSVKDLSPFMQATKRAPVDSVKQREIGDEIVSALSTASLITSIVAPGNALSHGAGQSSDLISGRSYGLGQLKGAHEFRIRGRVECDAPDVVENVAVGKAEPEL